MKVTFPIHQKTLLRGGDIPVPKGRMMMNPLDFIPVIHLMATAISLQKIQSQISLQQSAEGLILLDILGTVFVFPCYGLINSFQVLP